MSNLPSATESSDIPDIWVVDDDPSIRWVLERALQKAGMHVRLFENASGVLESIVKQAPDVLLTDIRMPGMDGLTLMKSIGECAPDVPVVVMTAHTDLDSAVAAYGGGAFEYLPKPFDIDEAIRLLERALEKNSSAKTEMDTAAESRTAMQNIVGEAPAMQDVFRAVGRLSQSNMTVLIVGESGTGKELIANALHEHSPRKMCPFVAINTAAIPADLLESELFGHEKGAFTGAQAQRKGRFEQANNGTLFLDEIGDMPPELQTRLLRVLSEGKFYRVGGHEEVKCNVRIIAATNQDLDTRVQQGLFREDLYHRLNVIRIKLPSLKQRREDIVILAENFLKNTARELQSDTKILSDGAKNNLTLYDWPGNVRELENVCRWLTVMAPTQTVAAEDLPPEFHNVSTAMVSDQGWEEVLKSEVQKRLQRGEKSLLDNVGAQFERVMLDAALAYTNGHKQEAAKCLGWGRNTLTRKLKQLTEIDQAT